MCWDFVGTTIEKVKVSCKLQRIVFNFIITFSTKGVLKWRMFGMYLEIGLHISWDGGWDRLVGTGVATAQIPLLSSVAPKLLLLTKSPTAVRM